MKHEQLQEVLKLHRMWLDDRKTGAQLNLANANIRNANLSCINIAHAKLEGVNLSNANLSKTYLGGADLRYADLRGANLQGADLTYANLLGINLRYADLRSATLMGVNLTGADLTGANLQGTNFRNILSARNVKGVDLQVINMPKHDIIRHGRLVAIGDEKFQNINYWLKNLRKLTTHYDYTAEELKLYKLYLTTIKKGVSYVSKTFENRT